MACTHKNQYNSSVCTCTIKKSTAVVLERNAHDPTSLQDPWFGSVNGKSIVVRGDNRFILGSKKEFCHNLLSDTDVKQINIGSI